MAAGNFERSLAAVLIHEGGYVNHPADPGGATNKGVIQRTYDGDRNRRGLPKQSVRLITDAEVKNIYRRQYWNAVRADELPVGIDYMVFDGAVNSGPSRSIKWLQKALGVKVDGIMGDATIDAVEQHKDLKTLIARVCELRMGFLKSLNHWPTFGKGWTSRVSGVKKLAQRMAEGSVIPSMPRATPGTNARAPEASIARPTRKQEGLADALATGGPVGSAVSGAATTLEPIKESSPFIMNIFVALALLGLILTIVGVVLKIRNSRKTTKADKAVNVEVEEKVPEEE